MRVHVAALSLLAVGLFSLSCQREKNVREEVLSELKKDVPSGHISVLTSLPDLELPWLEAHFAERAPHHPWLFGQLIARYATAKVLASVRSSYDAGHLQWDCDSLIAFQAYFLRVNPAEGVTILRSAMKERPNYGCASYRLLRISRIYASAELEVVAIEALNQNDPVTASDGAYTLARIGSGAAEALLWRRLERWTVQWRDRSDVLYGAKGTHAHDGEHLEDQALGNGLREALVTAQAWYFDAPRRQRLFDLCWTDGCRTQFAPPPWKPPVIQVRVLQLMYRAPEVLVGSYQPGTIDRFGVKISQFPAGTVFGWCTDRDGGGELSQQASRRFREQLKTAAESQGFRFLSDPPWGTCYRDRMANSAN